MTIDQALVSLLLGNANLVAVIGQRLSPALVIQGKVRPNATYQRISGRHVDSLSGSSGLCFARYQVNTFATTVAVARQAGELVRLVLHGYSGTVSDVVIGGITWEGDGEFLDESPDSDEARTYGFRHDFLVHYQEARPSFFAL